MGETEQLDALAIGAHPDDVEITSGGLIIKMTKMGRRVGVLDMTQGETGTHGDENDRAREAQAAAKVMGLVYRHNLKLPDSGLMLTQENRLKVAQVIRDTKPELLILPHWEQRHPDHRVTTEIGYDACFLAGLKKADLDGEPHRPRKIIYASYFRNREYSFLVDITDEFEQKMEAVAAYTSQFGTSPGLSDMLKKGLNLYDVITSGGKSIFQPGTNVYDLMQTRARQLGQLADCRYAEAYSVKEQIRIDDPQKMPVRSI